MLHGNVKFSFKVIYLITSHYWQWLKLIASLDNYFVCVWNNLWLSGSWLLHAKTVASGSPINKTSPGSNLMLRAIGCNNSNIFPLTTIGSRSCTREIRLSLQTNLDEWWNGRHKFSSPLVFQCHSEIARCSCEVNIIWFMYPFDVFYGFCIFASCFYIFPSGVQASFVIGIWWIDHSVCDDTTSETQILIRNCAISLQKYSKTAQAKAINMEFK